MVYDLRESLDREQFRTRAEFLLDKADRIVELTEKRQRSLAQNSYCHTIIAYFALHFGLSPAEVKQAYFKQACNPDIFVRSKHDKLLGRERRYLRSTSDISKEEMATAIDRFLRWASDTCGLYIPSADEYVSVQRMQYEVQRNKALL